MRLPALALAVFTPALAAAQGVVTTRGHGTHSVLAIWGSALADFLRTVRK